MPQHTPLERLLRKKPRKIPPTFVQDVNEQPFQTAIRRGDATSLDAFSRLRGSSKFAKQARRANFELTRQAESLQDLNLSQFERQTDIAKRAGQKEPSAPPPFIQPTYFTADQFAAGYFGVEPGATPTDFSEQQVKVARNRKRLSGAPAFVEAERRGVTQPLNIAREEQDLAAQGQVDTQALAGRVQTEAEAAGGALRQAGEFERGPSAFLEAQVTELRAAAQEAYAIGDSARGQALEQQATELANQVFLERQGGAPAPVDAGPFRTAPSPSSATGVGLAIQFRNTTQIAGVAMAKSGLDRMIGVSISPEGAPTILPDSPINRLDKLQVWSEDARNTLSDLISSIQRAMGAAKTDDAKDMIRDMIKSTTGYQTIRKWQDAGDLFAEEQSFQPYDFIAHQGGFNETGQLSQQIVQLIEGK